MSFRREFLRRFRKSISSSSRPLAIISLRLLLFPLQTTICPQDIHFAKNAHI